MKPKGVVHEAEEGGYWADVPAIPSGVTQGESFGEFYKICTEPLKGVYPSKLTNPTYPGWTK